MPTHFPPEAMSALKNTQLPPGAGLAASFAKTTLGSNLIATVAPAFGAPALSASQIRQGAKIAEEGIELKKGMENDNSPRPRGP